MSRSLVDSFPYYKFVATGSAAAALRLKSTESGAGRFRDFILPSLTFSEYLQFIKRDKELVALCDNKKYGETFFEPKNIDKLNAEFINYLNFGGYPEAVFSEDVRNNATQYIKSDIIDKVLLRDLPSLYGISDIQELNRLFMVLAYNTGCEVSLDGLSNSSGVAKNTLKKYLSYLEAAFLVRRVERIDKTARKFKRAITFKVYLTNPSMRAALFGQIDGDDKAIGPLVETAIYGQWQHSTTVDLYYAHWDSGEVDIVSLKQLSQKPHWAVEVKWSDHHYRNLSELENCVSFAANNPELYQPILVTTKTISDPLLVYKNTKFAFIESSAYAYTLGFNIIKSIYKIPHHMENGMPPQGVSGPETGSSTS